MQVMARTCDSGWNDWGAHYAATAPARMAPTGTAVSRARAVVAPLNPEVFAGAVLAGLAAGESGAGPGVAAERVGADGSLTVLEVPDSPHGRAAFALKRHFAGDEAAFRSAHARFRALMHLFAGGALGPWTRARDGGRTALHPAVIDVASRMRLSDNGRFAPRKFLDAVARAARESYPDLAGWDGD